MDVITLPPASFYGQMLARRDIGGLILTDFSYPADLRTPIHAHECAYFSLVLNGTHTQTYGGKVREALPRMIHFHPAGEVHRDWMHQAGTRIFSVEVVRDFVQRTLNGFHALEEPAEFQGGRLAELMLRLHHESYQQDSASRLAIEGLTLEVLAEAERCSARRVDVGLPRWLAVVREFLDAHFEEGIALHDVAASVDIDPSHLARTFRRFYGCTLGDYVRQRRLEYACHQLSTTETPLSQIALDAGFADQSHFCRAFKRSIGSSPSQFRAAKSKSGSNPPL